MPAGFVPATGPREYLVPATGPREYLVPATGHGVGVIDSQAVHT